MIGRSQTKETEKNRRGGGVEKPENDYRLEIPRLLRVLARADGDGLSAIGSIPKFCKRPERAVQYSQ
jgi:hypothetical protein